MGNKIKHLEMIEKIIERLSKNSFTLKGWGITLVVGIFALSSKTSDQKYILIAYIPILMFWFLDSYYLRLERRYKVLYKNIITKDDKDIDFNMDTNNVIATGSEANRICYLSCLFSVTEWLFYCPILVAITFLMKILKVI